MRPVLLAANRVGGGALAPLTFDPVAGSYTVDQDGYAEFTITANRPATWAWSSTGALASSNVANGGSAASITFSINGGRYGKRSTIAVTVGAQQWAIELTALGFGDTVGSG